MNKAGKHIQMPASGGGLLGGSPKTSASLLGSPQAQPKDVISSIMSFLPDNRPITSLQIVEDYEKCPKNFLPVHRTHDQDADADLWRENTYLFGRPTTRYLCISKTEGLPEYVVETLKVIAEKIQPPKEFSLLSRTADTEQKAWRKRQIAYKLSKRGTVTHAVTDIILCSKRKIAPDGFKLAGDINGVLVCFKTGAIPTRLPPPVPGLQSPQLNNSIGGSAGTNQQASEVEKALNRLNLNSAGKPLPPLPQPTDHDYEEIAASYRIDNHSPRRPAPRVPPSGMISAATSISGHNMGTLGGSTYSEVDGVPFMINPALMQFNKQKLPILPDVTELLKDLDYDFKMERQLLCTIKSSASTNPFFK